MKLLNVYTSSLLMGTAFVQALPSTNQPRQEQTPKPPTKVIAGVTVPDTPLITASLDYARKHSDDMTYNHVIRCWLFGSIVISKTNTNIDPEAHAVATILHDLGWDNTLELRSPDKRFEVDGAIAARNFIEDAVKQGITDGNEWSEERKQLVWDAIALHTTPSIYRHKQPLVNYTGLGIGADFQGPDSDATKTLTLEEFERVNKEFPRLDLAAGINKTICDLATTKPATTYDNFMQSFGEAHVPGYKEGYQGKRGIDLVLGAKD
ncbi:hypothetical protein HYFRA_00010866 [Hymenoscyphus fraxineus]|uniref:HD domain-containing protein n=1 Tax=Hymenoscyphus fraxineus TaxID=746836 RepID=A0A9N9KTE6_9HELO|nr:hypothetical protein HYFRA_00010866 [Hymenoscyphus fraxineus]